MNHSITVSQAQADKEKAVKKSLLATKHEHQERGHVSDLIAGWTPRPALPFSQWAKHKEGTATEWKGESLVGGQEHEAALRKLAQKGVVKLFNAIRVCFVLLRCELCLYLLIRLRKDPLKRRQRRSLLDQSSLSQMNSDAGR